MRFFLGTHRPHWLGLTDVPLFVSHTQLRGRASLPRALGPWALDSGAFSEIKDHGRFIDRPGTYAKAVKRYAEEIGGLEWCAPQDWMCEPFMLERTRYTLADHQRMTVDSYLELREYGIPVIPVVQGWTLEDYRRCVQLYRANGVDLRTLPLVGVGSVCRRQHTDEIEGVVASLAYQGLRLHAFGVKVRGLGRFADLLVSADSMAWSFDARRTPIRLPGCSHKTCTNCLPWALTWRDRMTTSTGRFEAVA